MSAKKWAYYLSKLTLIDEILGFIYWALAIFGIFIIVDNIENRIAMAAILGIYAIAVTVSYILFVRRIKSFLKTDPGKME